MYFRVKVDRSERCHNLGLGRIPCRRSYWGSCYFHILFTSRYKIHSWKLYVYGKIFEHGEVKSGRKSFEKKKKKEKKKAQRRKKGYHSVKERKISLCESDWCSKLASRFRTKKSPSNQNFPYMMLKTRFPFFHAGTSLDTKTLTITTNRNFESCMSIRCLVS